MSFSNDMNDAGEHRENIVWCFCASVIADVVVYYFEMLGCNSEAESCTLGSV